MNKLFSLALAFVFIASSAFAAQNIDGTYKFRKGSGKFEVDEREYKVSTSDLRDFAVLKDGKVKISKNKIKLNLKGVQDAFDRISGRISVSGPSSMTVTKIEGSSKYKGRTPVYVKVKSATYEVNIKVVLNVEVSGNKLILKAPVSGDIDYLWGLFDGPVRGEIKLEARRSD